ncbi:MAG TPA: ATP-binding protein, partial [Anaerolineae bacterium]|nr:ATP-binding protein [Anaerolineae bacterium]
MKQLGEAVKETLAASSRANMPTISSTSAPAEPCPICGGLGYVREDVPVDHPHFGKLFPCRCKLAELEEQRLVHLRSLSNLGHLSHMTFETWVHKHGRLPEEAARSLRHTFGAAERYADDPSGWLILLGRYGCGKTHLAAAIANRCLQAGRPVLFVVVPDLLDHLRATYSPSSPVRYDERFDEVRNAPLLILDDLGTQNATPWAGEKLYQILNHRYNARLPTVVTSNQYLDEIDLRIRSRLVDPALATVFHILAPDYRRVIDLEGTELSSLSLLQDMTFKTFSLREDELAGEQRENLKRTLKLCRDYAADPQDWLVLMGEYGCGKTHLAAAMANERQERGYSALFVVVPDLLDHLRATFSPSSLVRFD